MSEETKKKRNGRSSRVKMTPECYVLKKLRSERKLSMVQVGKLMDCSDSFISFLENGRAEIPKTDFLDKLLKIYDISKNAFHERCRRFEKEETDDEFIIKALPKLKSDQKFFIKSLVKQYLETPSPPKS
ncbi:MAG: helix-turn-helix transcriptional regulator [Bdellovibrio sp.]